MDGPVLVLGAGGLVGGALAAREGVVGLTRAACDLTDIAAVTGALDRLAPAAVINAAAQAGVDRADREAAWSFEVNGHAVGRLARECASRGVRLVHLSTDDVLDEDGPGRLLESTPAAPKSIYARSKLLGEQLALDSGAVVVRVQWVYRPGAPGFFSRTLEALARGEEVALVTDQVGSPTPTDVLAPALLAAAAGAQLGLFHFACAGEATPWTWIATAAACRGLPLRARPTTRAALGGAWRPARSCLDATRFAETFGVEAPDWEGALRAAMAERPGWP